jgi:hypothetical protein
MGDPADAAAILKRALDYPYATPERSYLYRDGEAATLRETLDLGDRSPLLAYGANAAPAALARKLAPLPGAEMPVLRAELADFDVVYSAHVSPYGAIPGNLRRSAGTVAPVFVAYPDPEQLRLLSASEPNYELRRLKEVRCRVEHAGELDEVDAYLSRHGCLVLDGSEVALAAVASAGRTLPTLTEPQVLERVRDLVEPGASLEEFVRRRAGNRLVFDRTSPE